MDVFTFQGRGLVRNGCYMKMIIIITNLHGTYLDLEPGILGAQANVTGGDQVHT